MLSRVPVGGVGAEDGAGAVVEVVGGIAGCAVGGSRTSLARTRANQALVPIDHSHAGIASTDAIAAIQELTTHAAGTLQLGNAVEAGSNTRCALVHIGVVQIGTAPHAAAPVQVGPRDAAHTGVNGG